ncbi:MAG: leucine-rich repeat protein [Nostocales cyanobacterium W4_Combined_metabat2_030]|nr:leucine-rich repeat protein [Nostocales cyanobacterium W4_Combined_metabat2_030]
MNLINSYLFSPLANTFIGGVSATLNTPALIAAKLGISVSRIKSFSIVGANIQFAVVDGTYTIPSTAFTNNTTLTYYSDPNGLVTQINDKSFFGCTNVTSYIFNGVTSIASGGISGGSSTGAFRDNASLTSFTALLLTSITGWNTFRGCNLLATVNCPLLASLTGGYHFYSLTNLNSLTVGKLTAVGDFSFFSCIKITFIDLSELITTTGAYQFGSCSLLANIVNLNKLPVIPTGMFQSTGLTGAITANLTTSIFSDAFYLCNKVTSYSFPAVTSITSGGSSGGSSTGTFRGNSLLTSFTAPLLTSITGWNAFKDAVSLVTFNTPNLATLGATTLFNNVFENIKTGCFISVKASLQTANAGAPDGDLVYASGTRGATIVYV